MTGISSGSVADRRVYAQNTEPGDTRDGILWVDTSDPDRTTFVYSADTSAWERIAPVTVSEKDVAETFQEDNVWFDAYDKAAPSPNNDIRLVGGSTGAQSRVPDDGGGSASTDYAGWVINPDEAISGLEGTLHSGCFDISRALIKRRSDGVIMAEKTGDWTGGDTISLSADLSAATDYDFAVGNGAGSDHGRVAPNSTPKASFHFSAPTGVFGGGSTYNTAYNWRRVKTLGSGLSKSSTGSIYVRWSGHFDVFDWDLATFQRTLDGETADVFLEENDGTGWVEIAGPISRGQSITAAPESDVRFRVDFDRVDTVNEPRVDSLYRRRIV